MTSASPKPAVFVDRDNTLIKDPGYLRDPDAVQLLDGAAQAVARLRAAGYPVVVVTNQSGVARGLLSEDDVSAVNERMQQLLHRQGTQVDAVYYCPYLDGDEATRPEYRIDSDLRKPKPGMLLLAARDLNLDLRRSWMIGDSDRDVQAGKSAGCKTILLSHVADVAQPPSAVDSAASPIHADATAPDFPSAVDIILKPSIPFSYGRGSDQTPDPGAANPSPAPASRSPVSPPTPTARPDSGATMDAILEELRMIRRERHFSDFALGHLLGAIAEAFALCAIGWGIYAAMNGADGAALIRLLAGIAFQLLALTCFIAARGK